MARVRHFLRFGRYLLQNRFDGEPAGVNDIARLRRELEERGMQFLDNRAVRLGGTGVYLVGIEDLLEGRPDLDRGLQGVPDDAPTILLSHNPDIIETEAVQSRRPDPGRPHTWRADRIAAVRPCLHADGAVDP